MDKLRLSILAALERFAQSSLVLRGRKVILGSELAELYGMDIEQVQEKLVCHKHQFPHSFAFRIASEELETLSKPRFESRLVAHRWPSYAFTEPGTIMAAALLNGLHSAKVSAPMVLAFLCLLDHFLPEKRLVGRFQRWEALINSRDEDVGALFAAICSR